MLELHVLFQDSGIVQCSAGWLHYRERERESVAVGESLEVQLGGAVVRRAQQEDGGRKNGENGREGAGLCLD